MARVGGRLRGGSEPETLAQLPSSARPLIVFLLLTRLKARSRSALADRRHWLPQVDSCSRTGGFSGMVVAASQLINELLRPQVSGQHCQESSGRARRRPACALQDQRRASGTVPSSVTDWLRACQDKPAGYELPSSHNDGSREDRKVCDSDETRETEREREREHKRNATALSSASFSPCLSVCKLPLYEIFLLMRAKNSPTHSFVSCMLPLPHENLPARIMGPWDPREPTYPHTAPPRQ